jgi:hypothetical protein
MDDAQAELIVRAWREAAAAACPGPAVDLAAAFQRHYTAYGTGLPPNFCLVLTEAGVAAHKFNPRHAAHPKAVDPAQIKTRVGTWPLGEVTASGVELKRLTIDLTLTIAGREIPCRTPRIAVNPAAVAMIEALGGTVPGR